MRHRLCSHRTACHCVRALLALLAFGLAGFGAGAPSLRAATRPTDSSDSRTVHVGILHSQRKEMAFSELPLIRATQMAIDEVNEEGGVRGCRVESIVKDGESDDAVFQQRAQELIDEGVVAIFGCWTSSSRIAVRRVVEASNRLLYYPVQYEGEDPSKNIFYLGAAPNQQILPAVQWVEMNLTKP